MARCLSVQQFRCTVQCPSNSSETLEREYWKIAAACVDGECDEGDAAEAMQLLRESQPLLAEELTERVRQLPSVLLPSS